MKFGVNPTDRNEITRMTKAGWTSQEMEDTLQISKEVIERFMPEGDFGAKQDTVEEVAPADKPKKAKKKKTKGKAKKSKATDGED